MKAGFSQKKLLIYNARMLQDKNKHTNESKSSFFEKHGFVLCEMPTKVKDWNEDYLDADTDISNIYHKEIETLLREELFPSGTVFTHIGQDNAVLRRGPGSKNNFYGSGVHQDYALTPQEYLSAVKAYIGDNIAYENWEDGFNSHLADSDIFCVICFWRPIGMEDHTLINNPLCVLDRSSLKEEDIVKTETYGFTPTGKPQPQLTLKHDEGQRWYYYPDMTPDEVLVFKQFFYQKSDPNGAYKSCFHSAFCDPREGPYRKQKRQSTEHRVRVFI